MEQLKGLFGEEKLSFDEFTEKVAGANIKLADLNGGEYVSKEKYNSLQAKYDKSKAEYEDYKAKNDVGKYADYDALKSENAELKAKVANGEKMEEVRKAGVDERYAKFVLTEVSGNVTDDKDFATALSEYVGANKQFTKESQKTVYQGSEFNKNTPTEKKSLGAFLSEQLQ